VFRVVFDTNIFVSALFGGPPQDAFQSVLEGRCVLIVSPHIMAEVAKVLREKIQMPDADVAEHVRQIGRASTVVRPTVGITVITDEPDNRVLKCAVAGRTDLIVSGDRHLLTLREHAGIPIVRTVDFLRTLGPQRRGS
jgi:uncharacterized protein